MDRIGQPDTRRPLARLPPSGLGRARSQAIALGGPVAFLDPGERMTAERALDQIRLRAWDLWMRKAAR
ncbi:hypothetical protein [Methylobacterium nigriterrae]|uniref:hypothetical protein n=1 Tax=Methylobacterium nigriterrae TaxID=3127512 RepID=UPI00301418C4